MPSLKRLYNKLLKSYNDYFEECEKLDTETKIRLLGGNLNG